MKPSNTRRLLEAWNPTTAHAYVADTGAFEGLCRDCGKPAHADERNPYTQQLLETERIVGRGDDGRIGIGARMEAADAEQRGAFECDCGDVAWYKSTIGAYKCVACGALYNGAGTRVDSGRPRPSTGMNEAAAWAWTHGAGDSQPFD